MVKADMPTSSKLATWMQREIANLPFADYFGPDALLVPAPRSSPLRSNSLWVPKRLTEALVKNGLGGMSKRALNA